MQIWSDFVRFSKKLIKLGQQFVKFYNLSSLPTISFMKDHIDLKAQVTTDQWTDYGPLEKVFENLKRIPSGKKGGSFPEMHRTIMNLKGWLRGMHHHVEHLQDYLYEYCYRFNRSFMKEGIFDNLMVRMVNSPPCFIKNIND